MRSNVLCGSGGVRLSGGQAQRLALARTLAHPRPVLILDDPFSALDRKTEDIVFANLQRMAKDKVVFRISHRLYYFPQMQKVIFMEDGKTFAENAKIKAMAVWKQTGGIVLADDSGLAVDYIGGEPGVYSARYLGEDTSYEIKNQAIIDRLADAKEEERTARFVSAIAAVLPDGSELVTEGTVEGLIAHEPAGNGGFGYDPIFYLPKYGVTSAEIPIEKKNEISHRGKALEAMKIKLRERL